MKHRRANSFIARLAAAALVLIHFAGPAASQSAEPGQNPFERRSKAEVEKFLTDSDWAKTQALRIQRRSQVRSIAGQTESETLGRTGELSSAEDPLDYRFTIRLHSALPVRQALVRLEQLKWNYEKRSAPQRRVFDEQAKRLLLDCPVCASNYVVSVSFSSKNSSGNDLVYKWFGSATLPSIKGYIYLANSRGGRRDLVDFIAPKAPGDAVYFIFPRLGADNKPLFTTGDRKLIFRMSDSAANSITNFNLDISKLIAGGKVNF